MQTLTTELSALAQHWFAFSLVLGVQLLLVLILRKPVRASFGAVACYRLWLLPAVWLPLYFLGPSLFAALATPDPSGGAPGSATPYQQALQQFVEIELLPFDFSTVGTSFTASGDTKIQGWNVLAVLWAAGTVALIFWHSRRWLDFSREVSAFSAPLSAAEKEETGTPSHFAPKVPVLRLQGLNSAALFGIVKPALLLPESFNARYDAAQRHIILAHESVHLRRGDNSWNVCALLLIALFWINPLVFVAWRYFRFDQELSCDALALGRCNKEQQKRYARTLLDSLNTMGHYNAPALSAWDNLRDIKERSLMVTKHLHTAARPITTLCSLLMLAALGASLTLVSAELVSPVAYAAEAGQAARGVQEVRSAVQRVQEQVRAAVPQVQRAQQEVQAAAQEVQAAAQAVQATAQEVQAAAQEVQLGQQELQATQAEVRQAAQDVQAAQDQIQRAQQAMPAAAQQTPPAQAQAQTSQEPVQKAQASEQQVPQLPQPAAQPAGDTQPAPQPVQQLAQRAQPEAVTPPVSASRATPATRDGNTRIAKGDADARAQNISERTGRVFSDAIQFLNSGQYMEARMKLEDLRVEGLSPFERSRYEQLLFNLDMMDQDYASARAHVEAALASGGLTTAERSTMSYQRAQLYLQERNYVEAAAALETWIAGETEPTSAAYYLLGAAYYYLNQFEQALGHAEKAVEIDQAHGVAVEAHVALLATLYSKAGRDEEDTKASQDPVPQVRVTPDYPQRALARGLEGWVKVRFTVSPTGAVVDPVVIDSSSTRHLFDDAALDAISQWRYAPKIEDGIAVQHKGVETLFRFALADA